MSSHATRSLFRAGQKLAKGAKPEKARAGAGRAVEVIGPCPDCKEGRRPHGTLCATCGGTSQVTSITREPDYMPGEDPAAGVLAYRAWLHDVFGRYWKGITDLSGDGAPPSELGSDVDVIIRAAQLAGDEIKVFRAQFEGKTRVEICAATNLSPARIGHVVGHINQKLHAALARADEERRARDAQALDDNDTDPDEELTA